MCPACPQCTFGPFAQPERITGLGVSGDAYGPALSADGLTLYLAEVPSFGPKRIMTATRNDRGRAFSVAADVSLVNAGDDIGTPFISADGLTLYFFSTRSGGSGDKDIMLATRPSMASSFGTPGWLAGVNSIAADYLPSLTPDELTMFFVSRRFGGSGDADLWTTRRANRSDAFASPTKVSELNTAFRETGPALARDALTLYFVSDRAGGLGLDDIWWTSRSDVRSGFSTPRNLTAVNSVSSDLDAALSLDGLELFFVSNRSGRFEIWRSARSCL